VIDMLGELVGDRLARSPQYQQAFRHIGRCSARMRETVHRALRFVSIGHCLSDSEDRLGEALKLEPTAMGAIMLAEFEEWLTQRNNALAIPMTVVVRTPGSIRLTFDTIIDAIEVFVLRTRY
jgi:hypothetical protein